MMTKDKPLPVREQGMFSFQSNKSKQMCVSFTLQRLLLHLSVYSRICNLQNYKSVFTSESIRIKSQLRVCQTNDSFLSSDPASAKTPQCLQFHLAAFLLACSWFLHPHQHSWHLVSSFGGSHLTHFLHQVVSTAPRRH